MNYRLSNQQTGEKRESLGTALNRLLPLITLEKGKIAIAFAAIFVTSAITL